MKHNDGKKFTVALPFRSNIIITCKMLIFLIENNAMDMRESMSQMEALNGLFSKKKVVIVHNRDANWSQAFYFFLSNVRNVYIYIKYIYT